MPNMYTQLRTFWLTTRRRRAASLLGIVALVSWGLGLTTYTLHLQHTCPSLLAQSRLGDPVVCPSETPKHSPSQATAALPLSPSVQDKPEPEAPHFSQIHVSQKEVVGIAAGSVAVIGLAIMGAPVLVTAGAGAAVWYAARALSSSAL